MEYIAYFILSVVATLGIQLVIYHFNAGKKVKYTRRYSTDTIFAGETLEMTETISNEKVLPLAWVRVESVLDPSIRFVAANKEAGRDGERFIYGEHNSVFSLAPYSQITRRYTMLFNTRGYYNLRTANISFSDMFGLASVRCTEVPIDAAVTVYPPVPPFESLGDLSKNLMGDVIVRRWIAEDPFIRRGVREYTPHDPQNRINWKASARTGSMMAHDFDYTADIRLMVCFNVAVDEQRQDDCDPRCIEEGISKAASIVQYAVENGIETAFRSNGKSMYAAQAREDFGTGRAQLAALMTQLAALRRLPAMSMWKLLEAEADAGLTETGILLITASMDERLGNVVDKLRQMDNLVEIMMLDRYTGAISDSNDLAARAERARVESEALKGAQAV